MQSPCFFASCERYNFRDARHTDNMTLLRCSQKLLKRLHQPAKPPEPPPQDNPLGEWYADIDSWRRQPFVVMLNAATGAVLVPPARAADLRRLNDHACMQLLTLLDHYGIRGALADAEAEAMDAGFTFAATRDRSLLGSLNERKFGVWMQFEHNDLPPAVAAQREWEGLFRHPALGRNARFNMEYHKPLDLVRKRLAPSAKIIPFTRPDGLN